MSKSRDIEEALAFYSNPANLPAASRIKAQDSPRWCDHCQKTGDHHTDRCLERERQVEVIREVIIEATDIWPVGGEPYVGWSLVLAERIVEAMGKGAVS